MGDDIKKTDIFYPETIAENPLPVQEGAVSFDSSQPDSKGEYENQQIKEQTLPTRRTAGEVISKTLNTFARKITAPFEFTQKGAIQIGEFEDGTSGDIKISPSGIVGRNDAGQNTFVIDGTTGDATFLGTVNASDFTVADETGLVSISNFTTTGVSGHGLNQSMPDEVWTVATGSEMTFTLERSAICLINCKVTFWGDKDDGSVVDSIFEIVVDGKGSTSPITRSHRLWWRTQENASTGSMHKVELLEAGNHTINLQGWTEGDGSTPNTNLYNYYLSYIIFGN
jgi:hypothetical protein